MEFHIREAREKAGYSQKELAHMIGVAQNTFHGYESGKHDPKSDFLIKIAKACNVTVDFLLGHNAESETKKSLGTAEAAPKDALRSTLLHNFDQLNQEGRERLVETSDDMVASGKYIKSDKNELGKAKNA